MSNLAKHILLSFHAFHEVIIQSKPAHQMTGEFTVHQWQPLHYKILWYYGMRLTSTALAKHQRKIVVPCPLVAASAGLEEHGKEWGDCES